MKVQELMSPHVTTLGPQATLQQAARVMQTEGVGLLPIMGMNNIPIGIVTDRDLALRGIGKRYLPETPVREVMTHSVYAVRENDELEVALILMESKKICRVLVCDDSGKLVGVLSLIDAICQPGTKTLHLAEALRSRTLSSVPSSGIALV